jgi:hypothetical protein
VVNTILDTLQQMAKLDRTDMTGTGDDKGQLNYFIIMIGMLFENATLIQADNSAPENMHAFVGDITKLDLPVLNPYLERVQKLYADNMDAYVNAVLRRSFGKSMVSCTTSLADTVN